MSERTVRITDVEGVTFDVTLLAEGAGGTSIRLPDGGIEGAFEERTIEMTETDEEAVVSKRARVIEEVAISRDVEERTETVRDTVRRTDVEAEEEPTGPSTPLGVMTRRVPHEPAGCAPSVTPP